MSQMMQQQRDLLIKLRELRLNGFAEMLETQFNNPDIYVESTFEERLNLCLDEQEAYVKNRRYANLIKKAKLKDKLSLNDIMKAPSPGLSKEQLKVPASNTWITNPQNIIIQGACGVGKTALCCAIGFNACKVQMGTYYYRTSDLLEELESLTAYTAKMKLIKKLSAAKVLILDDFGTTRPSVNSLTSFFSIIDNRTKTNPTVIATMLKSTAFIDYLGGEQMAESITDRLLNPSIRITLQGESRRKSLI